MSGFRNAGTGQAITNLPVVVENPNTTVWFFDYNTCAQGGVGGINIDDSSSETLQGFQVSFTSNFPTCILVYLFII
jgi:hypothetical protein